jgi:hypothetical protein
LPTTTNYGYVNLTVYQGITNGLVRNQSCSFISGSVDGAAYGRSGSLLSNYSCNVIMWYWYEPGTWLINATIKETGTNPKTATNNTASFNIQQLIDFALNPDTLNWTSVQLGVGNQRSTNNLTIQNRGNKDLQAEVLGIDLSGQGSAPNDRIYTPSFSASAADFNPCTGTVLQNNTLVAVSGAVAGHNSLVGNPMTENLSFCMPSQLTGIGIQMYSSNQLWSLDVI